MQRFLLSHNDLDGVGCGIIAKIAWGEEAEVRYNSIGGLNFQVARFLKRPQKNTKLFITDLSVNKENEEALQSYFKKDGKVELIDHHRSAEHLNAYEWAAVTVQYEDGRLASATSLLYEELKERGEIESTPILEEFVELVRQYDTWEWDVNNNTTAKRLNDLFFLLTLEEFEEKMLKRIKNHEKFFFDEFEQKLLEMEEAKIERYIRRKRRELTKSFIDEYCVGIVHAESYHSELGNELGKDYPFLDYIAIISVGGKRISLRTIHDHVDVSEVAGKFEGGGHAKASGCNLTTEAFKLFVTDVFTIEPLPIDAPKNRYNLKESPNGSLYKNRQEDQLFVYPIDGEEWKVEYNGVFEGDFPTYLDAENHIKKEYSAALCKDDEYTEFLMENVKNHKILQAAAEKLPFNVMADKKGE
ncbi:oligoribonuclease [Rossellomorea vietnamensis]|uniref:Oligoribonuclease n=2 Tax=Rossellomorea TaxID=2837508 RepID=A0A5D4K9N3_9BACI|nr:MULTISPECIES: DHH family phosphoesterase [Rossellomorea]TYR74091.1 oligoribonuclease [Rossellomorea vietnamensis]TYS82750.1 oligoribonuclease [Rossellomorea aquimaris]